MTYSENPVKSNSKGHIFLDGNETIEESVKLTHENGMVKLEKLNEIWEPASLEIATESLWVGPAVAVSAFSHHLAAKTNDGALWIGPNSKFENELTVEDLHFPFIHTHTPRFIYQSDDTGTWTGTLLEFTFPSVSHDILRTGYFKTDTIPASVPVRWQIWKGTDDTGMLIFDQVYPPSNFPASTEISIIARGYLEFENGETFFHRYSSDENFSLKMDATNTVPWIAADISNVREDNLLQTMPWEADYNYYEGQNLITGRKIYICNIDGVQTGTWESNSALWDEISHHAGINYWTKTGNDLSYDGGNATVTNGVISSYGPGGEIDSFVAGRNAGLNLVSGLGNVLIGALAGRNLTNENLNTFIGFNAGDSATGIGGSVAIGFSALLNADGANESIGIGSYAGRNATGIDNVFIGYEAGQNVSGNDNLFLGYHSGKESGATAKSVALGPYALANADTVDKVTAVGSYAGSSSDADGCVYIGYSAGDLNATDNALIIGNDIMDLIEGKFDLTVPWVHINSELIVTKGNIQAHGRHGVADCFIAGLEAGDALVSGLSNIFIGYRAGNLLTTEGDNTLIGIRAGEGSTGLSSSVALGTWALQGTTGVQYTLAFGKFSGQGSTADRCVYIGYEAGKDNTTDDKLFIQNSTGILLEGDFADGWVKVHGDLTLDNGDITLNDGNLIPYGKGGNLANTVIGAAAGNSLTSGIGGNTFVGVAAGYSTTGIFNTFIGRNAGDGILATNYNTLVGDNAGFSAPGLVNAVALGYRALESAIDALNTVAIGTTAGMGATGANGVYLGHAAGFGESTDNKLWISNVTNNLIEGDFTNKWVKVHGDLSANGDLSTQYRGGFGKYENLVPYSQDMVNWSSYGSWTNMTIGSSTLLAPDGTFTADQLDCSAGIGGGMRQMDFFPTPDTYTISFWARYGSGNGDFEFDFGGASAVIFEITDTEWTKFEFTGTRGPGTYLDFKKLNAVGIHEFWGWQVNYGSSALPYVATGNAIVAETYGAYINGVLTVGSDIKVSNDKIFIANDLGTLIEGDFANKWVTIRGNLAVDSTGISNNAFHVENSLGNTLFYVREDADSHGQIDIHDSSGAIKVQICASADSYLKGGNLTIGSPPTPYTAKLHVYENSSNTGVAAGIVIEQAGSGGDAMLTFLRTGTRQWQTGIHSSDDNKYKISRGFGTLDYFTIAGTDVGDVKEGYIGIWETHPEAPLHVAGKVLVGGLLEINNGLKTADNLQATFRTTDGNPVVFNIATIGSATSSEQGIRLDAAESGVSDDRPLVLQSYGGNVGIGVIDPDEKLEVIGNIKVSAGNILAYGAAGDDASFIAGKDAGLFLTIGVSNILIGKYAGTVLNGGNQNIIIGEEAGESIINESNNIFLGHQVGYQINTSGKVIAIGYRAGMYSTSSDSVLIGYSVANASTGSGGVVIGKDAGQGASLENCVYLGHYAGEQEGQDDKLHIGTIYGQSLIEGDFINEWVKIHGKLEITGSTILRTDVQVASTDALDVAAKRVIIWDTSAGDKILGGIINGIQGQIITIIKTSFSYTLTIEHNEPTGNQKIWTPDATDIVMAQYGAVTMIYEAGDWYVIDNY